MQGYGLANKFIVTQGKSLNFVIVNNLFVSLVLALLKGVSANAKAIKTHFSEVLLSSFI